MRPLNIGFIVFIHLASCSLIFTACRPANSPSNISTADDQDPAPVETGIVNGHTVKGRNGLSSFVVAIVSQRPEGTALCSGSILTADTILTAAHCLATDPTTTKIIFASSIRLANESNTRQVLRQEQNSLWQGDNSANGLGDLAILYFEGGLPKGFQQVTLAPKSINLSPHTGVRFLGYGVTNGQTHAGAGQLRQTDSTILQPLSSTQIETDGRTASVCFGDSGGPAFVEYNGQWVQWGLASSVLSQDCNQASVHTTVMSYIRWMNSTIDHLRGSSSTIEDTDSHGLGNILPL